MAQRRSRLLAHGSRPPHKVLFFHDINLSHEAHLSRGRVFGPLEGHPMISLAPGDPEILDISLVH